MKKESLAEIETEFAKIVWENEPMASKCLVELCNSKLGWKSTTTYTVLKRLCNSGFFKNENSVISSVISREEYFQKQCKNFVNKQFGGSLPCFLTAFAKEGITRQQLDELRSFIEKYDEG